MEVYRLFKIFSVFFFLQKVTIMNSFPMNSVSWISHCAQWHPFIETSQSWRWQVRPPSGRCLPWCLLPSNPTNCTHTYTHMNTRTGACTHTHSNPVHSLYSCLLNLLSEAFDLRPWLSLRDGRRLLVGNKLHLGSVIHHLSMTEPRLEMGSLLLFFDSAYHSAERRAHVDFNWPVFPPSVNSLA